jgi:hypothetical protein
MGYKQNARIKSRLTSVEVTEGEPIELKIERVVSNKEPITDGAPAIYTERKEGVISAYNIRTDRFEVAAEAMDKVSGSIQAKRDAKGKVGSPKAEEEKGKVVKLEKTDKVSEAKSTEGTAKAK